MNIRDLEDLLADIEIYSTYEQGANADYWRDITIVTEDELKKLQLIDKNSRGMIHFRSIGFFGKNEHKTDLLKIVKSTLAIDERA